jgi:integrase
MRSAIQANRRKASTVQRLLQAKAPILRRSIAKLINRKTGWIETAQEWLGHSSTAHTRAYIDAEDYREKANGVVAGLDI